MTTIPTIFISGPGRSGSTLLQALLDHHPELAVFPLEFNILVTYINVLKKYGRVTRQAFSSYLKSYTRLRYMGSIMPMAQGQDLDLRGMNAHAFWEALQDGEPKECSPMEMLGLFSQAFTEALRRRSEVKGFVMRSNNLYLWAYRAAFPSARFLYTVRNPVDLLIGFLKYHATDTFSLRRAMEYRVLVRRVIQLIRISLDPSLHGHEAQDTLNVRLEDLKKRDPQALKEVVGFVGVSFQPGLEAMTVLGKPYGGNPVQKIPPGRGGLRGLLRGRGYLTPFERDSLKRMLFRIPEGPYDPGQVREYADRICLRLPSVYIGDLLRNSIKGFRNDRKEQGGGRFRYKFPLDFPDG